VEARRGGAHGGSNATAWRDIVRGMKSWRGNMARSGGWRGAIGNNSGMRWLRRHGGVASGINWRGARRASEMRRTG